MNWLHPFIALNLCCGLVLALLPQGTLRRTAALVLGLMLTLCWADCLGGMLHWPSPEMPATILESSGYNAAGGE